MLHFVVDVFVVVVVVIVVVADGTRLLLLPFFVLLLLFSMLVLQQGTMCPHFLLVIVRTIANIIQGLLLLLHFVVV